MATISNYPPLITDDAGTVRIRGTRYKVLHLSAEHYQYGWTAEELLRRHPDLRPEQVYAAPAYFYQHREALVRQMEHLADTVEAQQPNPFTRDELLRRSAAAGE